MKIFNENGYELYLILSDLCNFSCAHCINTSGPKAERWSLEAEGIEGLAREINGNPRVEALHFTGGEPSLKLPQIRSLQAALGRPVVCAMTTNGWFVDRSLGYLDDLGLKELVISYDKFHSPFIQVEKLLPLIRHAQKRGIQVSVNFVFEQLQDLVAAEPFVEEGVLLFSSRLITAGRAEELESSEKDNWADTRVLGRSCPSLDPDQRRRKDLEKVVHLPGKGFTPCCGPLAFDELAEADFTFSKSLSHYPDNPLRKALGHRSFRAQAEALGIDLSEVPLQSACDACRLLYGRSSATVPELARIFSLDEDILHYPSKTPLDPVREKILTQKFHVSYVLHEESESVRLEKKHTPSKRPLGTSNQGSLSP